MPSEASANAIPAADRSDPFSRRTSPGALPELMDDCIDRDILRGCLQDLAVANRLTGAYRSTLRFLDNVLARRPPSAQPLRILDIGFGYGDTLRRIARWAGERRVPVELTGIDLNPLSASIAAEANQAKGLPPGAIAWHTGDVLATREIAPDLVLTSLVMHHLEDDQIVAMLRWMEANARVGWFINDLERQRTPARLWSVLAHVLRWHPFLHHDGPVSFRRAFRDADWHRYLAQAGISTEIVTVRKAFPARLCVARLR